MIQFSDDKLKEVQGIISRYPDGKQKSAVIPVLHLAQQEFGLVRIVLRIRFYLRGIPRTDRRVEAFGHVATAMKHGLADGVMINGMRCHLA